jgi:RNA-directed DNA polymerase
MVKGTLAQAEALKEEVAMVLASKLKLTLSPAKTLVTHIDDGFEFLGFRIVRKTRAGGRQVYTFPSPKAFAVVKRAVKALTRPHTRPWSLAKLLAHLNPILRGWCEYFRFAASKRTFAYLEHYSWWRVARWLWKKHHYHSWKRFRRRELKGWEIIAHTGNPLFRPARVPVERYRYRGARIASPWNDALPPPVDPQRRRTRINPPPTVIMESRMRGNAHVRFGGRSKETD